MHCENCGGNLSLEELTCPHCGSINKHAQQHVYDMNRYQGAFENTQTNVYTVTQKYAGITVRAAIITILLLLIVVFAVIGSLDYEIERGIREGKAKRSYHKYTAIMDEYLAEEDYIAFHAFCETNGVEAYDTDYEEYYQIIRVCYNYRNIYEAIFEGRSNMLQKYADEKTLENAIDRIAESLSYFYDTVDVENYKYYEGVDAPEKQAIVNDIVDKVEVLLQTYCGLTAEEAEQLATLSDAKRRVLLEERMLNAE